MSVLAGADGWVTGESSLRNSGCGSHSGSGVVSNAPSSNTGEREGDFAGVGTFGGSDDFLGVGAFWGSGDVLSDGAFDGAL